MYSFTMWSLLTISRKSRFMLRSASLTRLFLDMTPVSLLCNLLPWIVPFLAPCLVLSPSELNPSILSRIMSTALLSIATSQNRSVTTTPSSSAKTLAALEEYCSSSDTDTENNPHNATQTANPPRPSTPSAPEMPALDSSSSLKLAATPALAEVITVAERFQAVAVQDRMRRALRPSASSGFTSTALSQVNHQTNNNTEEDDQKQVSISEEPKCPGDLSSLASQSFEVEEIISSTRPIYEGLSASYWSKSVRFGEDAPSHVQIGLGLLEVPLTETGLGLLSQSPLRSLRAKHVIKALSPRLPSSLSFGSLAQLEEGLFQPTSSLSSSISMTAFKPSRITQVGCGVRSVSVLASSSSVGSLWNLQQRRAEKVHVTMLRKAFGVVERVFSGGM
ncbi:hypothetical protein MIND_01257300 [Mycena indigotica]|uniref:Uncharacterized protein n=1 Tax=Mycena indigotica TaxID=2126181 RepID=A0A8H6S1S6_9AGAR|nr:uncharacterized protein MIND_01257300 [Mycena indigotica]KAF7291141.1 hypothetical protein MIND_01257300 [Mycena indigotica]